MTTSKAVDIVEVGPRDGFQNIDTLIPTATKVAMIRALYEAGLRRIEIGSFVGKKAVPQMADTEEVLRVAETMVGLDAQVLVPSRRKAQEAVNAGAKHIAFVLSASPSHNMNNVRRLPTDSVEEYRQIVDDVAGNVRIRVNVATAFHCPFEGPVESQVVLDLLGPLIDANPEAEICLCDTTGRVTPDRVRDLSARSMAAFPQVRRWAYHGHDTYGLGVANALAAFEAGISTLDASIGGLGGCPFAPGAAGNVATEDLVWTLGQMNVETKISLEALLPVARLAAGLPDACSGGRVRDALAKTATQSASYAHG